MASSELGWFYKTKLGLDPLRSQLLETALGGSEDYNIIEREVLRLFKDLHAQDPLARRPAGDGKGPLLQRFLSQQSSWPPSRGASSYAPSMASSAQKSFRSAASSSSTPSMGRFSSYRKPSGGGQKQAMVSEAEPEPPGETREADVDEGDPAEGVSLEEVLEAEAEVLAAELAEAAEGGMDEEAVQEIEESVGQAAEALLTMREAKTKLQEVKRDRGYGRVGGVDQKGKVNPKKSSSKHPCFDCDLPGHWAGDPECKKPGQGLGRKHKSPPKQVKLAEALTTEFVVEPAVDSSSGPGNEVMVVNREPSSVITPGLLAALDQSHVEPKEVNIAASMARDKRLVGALDSACNRTCTGPEWLAGFLESLKQAPQAVRDLVSCRSEHEVFRFGNGGAQISSERWRLPMCVGGKLICFWTSVVPVPSIGLLLGRDFLEAVGAEMSFPRRTLVCAHLSGTPIKLKQLTAGHFLLELLPSSWPGVGPQRWKRLGIDSVLEVQMNTVEWLRKRLRSKSFMSENDHDHLLTEKSVKVGHLVCAVMSDVGCHSSSLVQASSMPSSRVALTSRSTSSTTRISSPRGDGPISSVRPNGRASEEVHDADRRKVPLGRKRSSLVGVAKALAAISVLAVPLSHESLTMASTNARPGASWSHPSPLLGVGGESGQVHNGKSERVHPLEEPAWDKGGILRRSSSDWNVGSTKVQGNGVSTSSCSGSGGSIGSSEGCRARSKRDGSSRSDRSSWWSSFFARRFGEARSLASGGNHRKGLCESNQRESQAYGRAPEGANTFPYGDSDSFRKGKAESSGFQGSCSSQVLVSACGREAYVRSDGEAGRLVGHGAEDGSRTCSPPSTAISSRSRSWESIKRDRAYGDRAKLDFNPARCPALDSRGDSAHERRCLRGTLCSASGSSVRGGESRMVDSRAGREGGGSMNDSFNPFALNQEIKKGQAVLISQAWSQHEADRVRISKSPAQVRQILEVMHEEEVRGYLTDEPFIQTIDLSGGIFGGGSFAGVQDVALSEKVKPPDKNMPLVSEVYTTAQNIMKEAVKVGHQVGTPMSLETGWDFLNASHRKKARELVKKEKPFCLVLAFPCGPFSPLQRLNPNGRATLEERQVKGRILMNFAIELSKEQLAGGRHCLLENPLPSLAWDTPEMKKFLEENELFTAVFDRSLSGALHKKPTKVVSSSPRVLSLLDGVRCKRDHVHMPVMGGSKITAHAGIYPKQLARAIVRGLMDQFEADFRPKEVFAASAGGDGDGEELVFVGGNTVGAQPEVFSDDDEESSDETKVHVSAGLKQAIRRLHENTGHRSPKRLARALAIAGAPSEAVAAAKAHRCDICAEKAPAKSRRPASLPVPKDMGDQVHVDLIEIFDAAENRFYVAHATDFATRFQAAEVLDDKSTKSVINFLTTRWLATFGAPRVLVCDQGREFVSWEMEEWASSVSTLLHHIAVQAPWQNGVAERSGGILKTILNAVIASNSVIGKEDLQFAVAESIAA